MQIGHIGIHVDIHWTGSSHVSASGNQVAVKHALMAAVIHPSRCQSTQS